MTSNIPAERFPPGDFIKEELEAREWTQGDFADITGIDRASLNLILNGRRKVTPETAAAIGAAFGTGAQLWLNLESSYQLWRQRPPVEGVARRARLYELAPMKELLRRRWIEPSEDIDVLEQRICEFFEVRSLDDEPRFYVAARMSAVQHTFSKAQLAWLFRAKRIARAVGAATFSNTSLRSALAQLGAAKKNKEDVRHIPRILADAGIRLVVVEHVAGTKIDGACIWMDENSPVVALSFRYDRIDWFWHTLIHELKHVENRDGLKQRPSVDIALVGKDAARREDKPAYEQAADGFASEFLVPNSELEDFIVRFSPMYSKARIAQFAARIGVHPGIVVGQLQFKGEIPYSHSRETLVPVRELLVESALTDGWGTFIATAV